MEFNKIVDRLGSDIRNEVSTSLYLNGIEALIRSGVIDFLKHKFRHRLDIQGSNPSEMAALKGAYTAGVNDMLDTLLNFKELYLETNPDPKRPLATFGSVETALKAGNISKEEADAIKSGTRIDYTKFLSKPKPRPTAIADSATGRVQTGSESVKQ